MGWSAQDIEKLRKKNDGQKSTAGSTGNSAGNSSTHSVPAPSAGGGSQSGGWSAEKIDAMRANSGVKATAKNGTDAWVNRGAGTSVRSTGNSKNSAGNSSTHSFPQGGSLGAEVLKQMNGVTGTPAKTGNSRLQLAVPQEKKAADTKARPGLAKTAGTSVQRGGNAQPEWLTKPQPKKPAAQKEAAPAATVRGTVQPTADQRAQARRSGSEGVYAMGAQAVSDYTEEMKATDKFSDFDRLNQWMDADPKHRELVALLRTGKGNKTYAERSNAMQPDGSTGAAGWKETGQAYTDAELMAKGYSRKQISEARQYITDFDALPEWQRAARRTSNTIGGIGYTVAAAPFLAGESVVQAVKNETTTTKNWTELQQSVQGDARQRELLRLMTGGKTQYAGRDNAMQVGSSGAMAAPESTGSAYTDEELKAKGYSQSEIDRMRARISGTKVSEGIDPEKSFGYQLYHRGQQLNEAAQAGMSPAARTAMGIATSAAENLAVAGISPALVLPVLSAQGGAESMGQSIEKGDSAGKTLAGGLAKFGAGWAINSVGAADLAKTMGSDYAKNTLAGKLADVVRSVADNGTLAQQYPTIANTISGGVDNAMQAFVETYADMAIDAALGDAEAAQNLYKPETFLQAVESGLTGGASGALGGAVGTQLGKMRAALETEGTQAGNELPQSPAGDSSLREGALETAEQQAAANDRQVGNAAQMQEKAAVVQQEAANEKADLSEKTGKESTDGVRYSIQVDADGNKYVQVDGDILDGMAPENQLNAVRDAIRDLFPDGFERDGKHIDNTREGRGEFVRSKYSRTLESSNPEVHADKMRMAGNLDEIIQTSDNVQNEKAKHKNAESFNRGKVNVRVGANDYSVDVVTAIKNDGREVQYDLVNIQPTKINAPDADASEAFGDSRRTTAEPAEADRRGQPGTTLSATAETAMQESTGSSPDGNPDTTVTQRAGDVNSRRVENTGEMVESQTVQAVKELAKRWQVSDAAAESMSRNMPEGVGAEVYAPAAASLYRLGVNGEGESFADALQMTGSGALSGAVRQVLATGETGRLALEMAYTQGKGEAERYKETKAAELGNRPGAAALREDAGTLYSGDGTESGSRRAGDELIRLTAGANGLAAQRVTEGIRNRAKGLIQSSIGKVFYSGDADTATVLHETFHAANSWDSAGAQEMIDTFEHYLVKQNGMDSVMQLVESYLDRYEKAGQSLTYNQAMEEITADAMQSIFGSEESFKNFLRQQALEAQANAGALGKCQRVMEKIGAMLEKVLADIKNLLVKEPTNAAARAAKTLTETQLKDLQQIWMNHQADAGEAYRAALEANGGANKNAADSKAAAEGEKYSIDPDYAEKIDEWNKEGRNNNRTFILGRTGDALQSLGARENDIYMKADKINTILKEHPEMTLEEIKRIPEILDDPVMILTSQNKGRTKQNTRLVMFGDVKAQDGRPVLCVLDLRPVENHIVINDMQKVTSAYTKDVNPVEFVRKSDVLYVDKNKERTTELFRTLGFKIPSELQLSGSIGRITYGNQDVKLSGVKFTELEQNAAENKYQLDVDSEDVEAAKEAQMGSGRAAGETIQKVMEQAQNARVSDESLEHIARKMVKVSASRMDTKTLANRLRALSDYLADGKADWAEAHGFVLDMAQQIMEKSAKKNDELWKAYPELHEMGMSLAKGSKDYNEVLYKYGSWAEARKELARHGVKLTLTKDGAESRWDADFPELQKLGAGLFPEEVPSSAADALEAMAAAHDAIRPTMESAYDSDWDAAKQEKAMEIWGEYLGLPGIASGKNAALRAEFAEKRKEMNTAARKQAVRLQAEANLAAAKQRASDRQKMRQPYTDMAAKAQADYREAETKLRAELGAKEMKLEQQAAMQREAERGRAREKVAIARAKNEQRLAQMRESRDKDNTRRAIRKVTGELTKLYEHPKEGSYIPEYLLDKVMPVLQLANEVTGNRETAERLASWRHRGEDGWSYSPMQDTKTELTDAVDGLRNGIKREIEAADRANLEWEQSGLTDAIGNWLADVNDNREREIARLEATMRNAQKWGEEYGGIDGTAMEAYLNALQEELDGYKNGGMAALSAAELRGLRDILEQTAHIIKIDNVVVGAQEDAMIDDFAEGAKSELAAAKGVSKKRGLLGKMSRAFNSYRMNTMNIERMFERLGGYDHGGYIENLGQMLNDGQRKKTKILIEGERIFDNVTGKEHEKELYHYTHDLADVGFRDASGRTRKITHDQMAELWLQLQNPQGLHHILHGGVTLEDMEARLSGDTELAQLNRETVRVGELNLRDAEGKLIDLRDIDMDETAVRRSLLEELDKNLTDYDRAWIEDYKKLNAKMSGYINETSLLLSGTRKATTENYIHINVDEDANPEQNKGIRYDNSVGNPGWLNHRVNSSKPVLLVGLAQQVNTSIRNTAQYAGMAVPLRNAEKILNSMQEGKTLFKQVEDTWGKAGREYLNKALADLCEVKDSREVGDGFFARLRSNAAQAVLSANVNVTLLQAASLPTAAAELGWRSTGAAAVQFGANILDPMNIAQFFGSKGDSALTRIEARMAEHGDELLQYRLRGTGTAELGSAGAQKGAFGRAHDAARNSGNALVSGAVHAADKAVSLWTGGITKMDEITVAALWAGSESYVKSHPEEFAAGAEVTDSPAYWAAVNEKFERVVERTQPNYTAMQRTGYQRTKNEMAKFLMMFSTQRQQNAQIWTASVEDMLAQYERYGKSGTAEAKAEIQKANERFLNAATSQVVQTAVIALMGIGVKFFLHRWKDLQDDNGDMTAKSIADAFLYDYLKSFMGNWTGGSEVMSAGEMILNHSFTSYDTISMTGISAINDLTEAIGKVYQLNAEDTSGMTEAQLETHKQKTAEAVADMLGQFGMLRGIPYTNLKKQAQAVSGWVDTAANWSKDGGNFDGLPASATSQYDRLYNAYVSGDKEEAQAAAKKLDQMVQAGAIAENKMYDQLKTRLKKYDGRVREAAQQTNAGNWEARKDIVDEVTGELKKLLNTDDPDVHDTVVGAVDAAANEMLATEKGYDKSAGIYAGLRDAVDSWNAQNVQEEYDRLVRAGKDAGNIRKKITELAKPDYLAGSDADKEQMADVLLSLTDADGNALYTEKNFGQWEKAADKAAEKEAEAAQNPDRRDLLK